MMRVKLPWGFDLCGFLTGVPGSSGTIVFLQNDQLAVGMYVHIEPCGSNAWDSYTNSKFNIVTDRKIPKFRDRATCTHPPQPLSRRLDEDSTWSWQRFPSGSKNSSLPKCVSCYFSRNVFSLVRIVNTCTQKRRYESRWWMRTPRRSAPYCTCMYRWD